MGNFKIEQLTIEQLENQISTINNARFLMENDYNGSSELIKELARTVVLLEDELIHKTIW